MKWFKRLKMMRISKYAIIICLLLAIIFAGFTVYGARTGRFVVHVEQVEGVDLAVYMKEDKSDMRQSLEIDPLSNWTDFTYNKLVERSDTLINGLGVKNDQNYVGGVYNRYMCFSFMLVNRGSKPLDVLFELAVTHNKDGPDGGNAINAVRVSIIEGENSFESGRVFAKAEQTTEDHTKEEAEELLKYESHDGKYRYVPYETKPFISDTLICSEEYVDLKVGEERKYTLVLWLEGQDIECVDDVFEAELIMELDIIGIVGN